MGLSVQSLFQTIFRIVLTISSAFANNSMSAILNLTRNLFRCDNDRIVQQAIAKNSAECVQNLLGRHSAAPARDIKKKARVGSFAVLPEKSASGADLGSVRLTVRRNKSVMATYFRRTGERDRKSNATAGLL